MKYYLKLVLLLFINVLFGQEEYNVSIYEKIGENIGGFNTTLDLEDWFGYSVEHIGDLNGDGVSDVAVGSLKDDDGGFNKGAVYILFLNIDGSVNSTQKISDTEGGFTGVLSDWDIFGTSISYLGDINSDGLIEIGVGAEYDGDGGYRHGAIWILSLNDDGTVASQSKISDFEGEFYAVLDDWDVFGTDITNLGDLNGDGINDIAVSARRDGDGGAGKGAVYILFLNNDFTVNTYQKISSTQGNLNIDLDVQDYFGGSVANIGDLNNDGVIDLAVGAYRDDDGGSNKGAVYILFMNSDGTVLSSQKISETQGNLNESFNDNMYFGKSIDLFVDLNADGLVEIIVGASGFNNDGEANFGAFYILNLNTDGTVNSSVKYTEGFQNFDGDINSNDSFGFSITYIDKLTDKYSIGVGSYHDNEGGIQKGSIWILQLGLILSIEDLNIQNKIFLYPNPTRNAFSLSDISDVDFIQIFDMLGREVLSFNNINTNQFNVSYLPIGEYIIKVIGQKGAVSSYKLIKE